MALLAQGWTLRFRFQGKVSSFADNLIGPDTKVSQLKQLLTAKGNICHGIAPSQLRFRGGFPPRILSLKDDDAISKNSVIRNKDMLLIELVDNSGNRIPMAPAAATDRSHNRATTSSTKSSLSHTTNTKETVALRRSNEKESLVKGSMFWLQRSKLDPRKKKKEEAKCPRHVCRLQQA